jgi:hypothetical protein
MKESLFTVVTTVQRPTPAMARLADVLQPNHVPLLVVGDRKGPDTFQLTGAELVTLGMQQSGPFRIGRTAPAGHYARKNVGYLMAIARGATCIYETDDDNAPLTHWSPRSRQVEAVPSLRARWVNVYEYFTDSMIWPRGYPLEHLQHSPYKTGGQALPVTSSIQQGLANGSPDVDAIWRLILDRPFDFQKAASVSLDAGSFCPFNSQSTWWWAPAFPLLYLPSYCSFRITDIWRGFIAQRCLWEIGEKLVFHAPEVVQERNEHRLLNDFRDEVPGYLANDQIIEALLSTTLSAGPEHVGANLIHCYEVLVTAGHIGKEELPLVHAWLDDLATMGAHPPAEREAASTT